MSEYEGFGPIKVHCCICLRAMDYRERYGKMACCCSLGCQEVFLCRESEAMTPGAFNPRRAKRVAATQAKKVG